MRRSYFQHLARPSLLLPALALSGLLVGCAAAEPDVEGAGSAVTSAESAKMSGVSSASYAVEVDLSALTPEQRALVLCMPTPVPADPREHCKAEAIAVHEAAGLPTDWRALSGLNSGQQSGGVRWEVGEKFREICRKAPMGAESVAADRHLQSLIGLSVGDKGAGTPVDLGYRALGIYYNGAPESRSNRLAGGFEYSYVSKTNGTSVSVACELTSNFAGSFAELNAIDGKSYVESTNRVKTARLSFDKPGGKYLRAKSEVVDTQVTKLNVKFDPIQRPPVRSPRYAAGPTDGVYKVLDTFRFAETDSTSTSLDARVATYTSNGYALVQQSKGIDGYPDLSAIVQKTLGPNKTVRVRILGDHLTMPSAHRAASGFASSADLVISDMSVIPFNSLNKALASETFRGDPSKYRIDLLVNWSASRDPLHWGADDSPELYSPGVRDHIGTFDRDHEVPLGLGAQTLGVVEAIAGGMLGEGAKPTYNKLVETHRLYFGATAGN